MRSDNKKRDLIGGCRGAKWNWECIPNNQRARSRCVVGLWLEDWGGDIIGAACHVSPFPTQATHPENKVYLAEGAGKGGDKPHLGSSWTFRRSVYPSLHLAGHRAPPRQPPAIRPTPQAQRCFDSQPEIVAVPFFPRCSLPTAPPVPYFSKMAGGISCPYLSHAPRIYCHRRSFAAACGWLVVVGEESQTHTTRHNFKFQ